MKLILTAIALTIAAPAAAQAVDPAHAGHGQPAAPAGKAAGDPADHGGGCDMPCCAKMKADGKKMDCCDKKAADPHAGHDMSKADPHAGHKMGGH